MSETTRPADTAKKSTDQTARSGQSSGETAGKMAKDAISEGSQMAQDTAERARRAGLSITETVAETAHAATNMSTAAAEQSREAIMMGVRTAAGVGGRMGDINFGRSRHMMASTAHAMDIYRDASEKSAASVQALFSTAMTMGRGMQTMQHAWLEMLDHSMEHAAHKPQDLLRCKNLVELAEVQRDLYLDAVNHMFESTSRLFDLAGRTVQDAVHPLRS